MKTLPSRAQSTTAPASCVPITVPVKVTATSTISTSSSAMFRIGSSSGLWLRWTTSKSGRPIARMAPLRLATQVEPITSATTTANRPTRCQWYRYSPSRISTWSCRGPAFRLSTMKICTSSSHSGRMTVSTRPVAAKANISTGTMARMLKNAIEPARWLPIRLK